MRLVRGLDQGHIVRNGQNWTLNLNLYQTHARYFFPSYTSFTRTKVVPDNQNTALLILNYV